MGIIPKIHPLAKFGGLARMGSGAMSAAAPIAATMAPAALAATPPVIDGLSALLGTVAFPGVGTVGGALTGALPAGLAGALGLGGTAVAAGLEGAAAAAPAVAAGLEGAAAAAPAAVGALEAATPAVGGFMSPSAGMLSAMFGSGAGPMAVGEGIGSGALSAAPSGFMSQGAGMLSGMSGPLGSTSVAEALGNAAPKGPPPGATPPVPEAPVPSPNNITQWGRLGNVTENGSMANMLLRGGTALGMDGASRVLGHAGDTLDPKNATPAADNARRDRNLMMSAAHVMGNKPPAMVRDYLKATPQQPVQAPAPKWNHPQTPTVNDDLTWDYIPSAQPSLSNMLSNPYGGELQRTRRLSPQR